MVLQASKIPTCNYVYSPLNVYCLGKIYVENERARLTHRLAKIKEEEGENQEATKLMQDLQVETYGSMERREKVIIIQS